MARQKTPINISGDPPFKGAKQRIAVSSHSFLHTTTNAQHSNKRLHTSNQAVDGALPITNCQFKPTLNESKPSFTTQSLFLK